MAKCIYKSDNKCCCSTSGSHRKIVDEVTCLLCGSQQETVTVSDRARVEKIKELIRQSIVFSDNGNTQLAKRLLELALET
jgi:hypothetical protein